MDKSFVVTVTDISRREYTSALRRLQLRKELVFLAIVAVVFVYMLIARSNGSSVRLAIPVLMGVGVVAICEATIWMDYSKFPRDLQLTYEIDDLGWRLRIGEDSAVCFWMDTVKLVETKQLFLMYNTKTASNILPKRCLTEEQCALIRSWYKSRNDRPAENP